MPADENLQFGEFSCVNEGTLVVQPAAGNAAAIPYAFRVVSDLMGDLEVSVVDEFFYFTPEAPKVEGATVTLSDVSDMIL